MSVRQNDPPNAKIIAELETFELYEDELGEAASFSSESERSREWRDRCLRAAGVSNPFAWMGKRICIQLKQGVHTDKCGGEKIILVGGNCFFYTTIEQIELDIHDQVVFTLQTTLKTIDFDSEQFRVLWVGTRSMTEDLYDSDPQYRKLRWELECTPDAEFDSSTSELYEIPIVVQLEGGEFLGCEF